MAKEKQAEYYDEYFIESGDFQTHYKDSIYFVHWTQVIQFLRKLQQPKLLEVGCGTGQLAEYLRDEGFNHYVGFDFSKKGIDLAQKRIPEFTFFEGNALDSSSFSIAYDVAICLEVLEHIERDLEVIRNIETGKRIIFSLPNFKVESHVRWFVKPRQIKARYYKLIDITSIIPIGNIFVCHGIRKDFSPNIFQRVLKSREPIGLSSITKRLKQYHTTLLSYFR